MCVSQFRAASRMCHLPVAAIMCFTAAGALYYYIWAMARLSIFILKFLHMYLYVTYVFNFKNFFLCISYIAFYDIICIKYV